MKKVAVVLFNLGAPTDDKIDSIKEFLFSLFNDPSIIRLYKPLRYLLAKYLTNKRCFNVQKNYRLMGGCSPLLRNTRDQAMALEKELNINDAMDPNAKVYKIFLAMRHYHPRVHDILTEIEAFAPTDIILLPLYPQFSSTTTGSSLREWQDEVRKLPNSSKLHSAKTVSITNYYDHEKFIAAHCDLIEQGIQQIVRQNMVRTTSTSSCDVGYRILFSAHGLPEQIARSDPYQGQIESTVSAIVKMLAERTIARNMSPGQHTESAQEHGLKTELCIDYVICYQSKVGPLPWLKPSTFSYILGKSEILISRVSSILENRTSLEYFPIWLQIDKINPHIFFMRPPQMV